MGQDYGKRNIIVYEIRRGWPQNSVSVWVVSVISQIYFSVEVLWNMCKDKHANNLGIWI